MKMSNFLKATICHNLNQLKSKYPSLTEVTQKALKHLKCGYRGEFWKSHGGQKVCTGKNEQRRKVITLQKEEKLEYLGHMAAP